MKIYLGLIKIVLTALFITTISCHEDEIQIIEPESIAYLALGDSYTIGQGVEESQRWPNQLSERLEENDYEISRKNIIAQTGWKTSDLLNAIENVSPEDYNLVSLLIGVNNQFQNQSFEIFNTEFDSLLNKSILFAGTRERVFVLSIPDYGVTPFGSNNSEQIAQELDMYNNYMKQRCLDEDVPFIDITGISRQLGNSPGALASDNLHPSSSQYTNWVEEILPVVLEILIE
ncbi:MAG: acyl-CoA thioesterase-1 [Maribacter sp.]|jgi:acyl-CoA thioesterase-1